MKSQIAVIAGSDGDIGKVVAAHFHAECYTVIGLSRSAREIKNLDQSYKLELSDFDAVEKLTGQIESEHGKVKTLVNCAGSFKRTLDVSNDPDVFKNNLIVADNLLKAFTPKMKETPGARIITVGSWDGLYPNINSYSYAVTKAGIRTLVQLYKKTHKETHLNFDMLLPGAVNTKMRKDKQEDKEGLVQCEDIAKLCVCLASMGSNLSLEEIVMYPKKSAYVGYRP